MSGGTFGVGVIGPLCAVCGTVVGRVTRYEDTATQETVVRAECHGKVQEVRLAYNTMTEASRIVMTVAFATPSAEDKP